VRYEAGLALPNQHNPSRGVKTSFQALDSCVHPRYPPNASPRRVPKCYTKPGIVTSLTRAGSRGRQKAIVRRLVVMNTCGGQSCTTRFAGQADQACKTRSSGPKRKPRVESDAGRARCKLQENAYETLIGARRAQQQVPRQR